MQYVPPVRTNPGGAHKIVELVRHENSEGRTQFSMGSQCELFPLEKSRDSLASRSERTKKLLSWKSTGAQGGENAPLLHTLITN